MPPSAIAHRRSFLLGLVIGPTLGLGACTRLPIGQVAWSEIGNASLTLIRIDPAPNHQFHFRPQGTVAASFIQPNGSVVAPLLYWRAEGRVLIISEQPGGPALLSLSDPVVKDQFVLATESTGLKVRFKYQDAHWPF